MSELHHCHFIFTDIKRGSNSKSSLFNHISHIYQHHHSLTTTTTPSLSSPLLPRINCFPSLHEVVSKSHLAACLAFAASLWPGDYDFAPVTHDLAIASQRAAAEADLQAGHTLIVKPSRGSQGSGIQLVQTRGALQGVMSGGGGGRHYVASRYVGRPCLLDGYKFDLRVYVLLESLVPLKLHVFQDGLARLCTTPYQSPSQQNLQQQFMHLTNYAVNKLNASQFKQAKEAMVKDPIHKPNVAVKQARDGRQHQQSQEWSEEEDGEEIGWSASSSAYDDSDSGRLPRSASAPITLHELMDDSSKRSIRAALAQLRHQGIDIDPRRFWSDVAEVVEKTIISMLPALWERYSPFFGQYHHSHALGTSPSSGCFQLLGFDLLLDEQLKLWLLEVNSAPSLTTDSPLDYKIKMSIWEKCIEIIGVHSQQQQQQQQQHGHSHLEQQTEEKLQIETPSAQHNDLSPSKPTPQLLTKLPLASIRHLTVPSPYSSLSLSARSHSSHRSMTGRGGSTPRPLPTYRVPMINAADIPHYSVYQHESSYSHLYVFTHPFLLSLYAAHQSVVGDRVGLTRAAFCRIAVFFSHPGAAADLLFLHLTKRAREKYLTYEPFCRGISQILNERSHQDRLVGHSSNVTINAYHSPLTSSMFSLSASWQRQFLAAEQAWLRYQTIKQH